MESGIPKKYAEYVMDNLPAEISRKFFGAPDLITIGGGFGDAFVVGAHRGYDMNFLFFGNDVNVFYTISDTEHSYAANIDIGANIKLAWFRGSTVIKVISEKDILGLSKSWGFDIGLGCKYFQMYDNEGNVIFDGIEFVCGAGGGVQFGSETNTHK